MKTVKLAVALLSSSLVALVACSGADESDHASAALVPGPGVAQCEHPSLGCDPPSEDDDDAATSPDSVTSSSSSSSSGTVPPTDGGQPLLDGGAPKKDGGSDAGTMKLHCSETTTTLSGCPAGDRCCPNPTSGGAPVCVVGKICPP